MKHYKVDSQLEIIELEETVDNFTVDIDPIANIDTNHPEIFSDATSVNQDPPLSTRLLSTPGESEKCASAALKRLESNFCLKMSASLLAVDVINEILDYSERVHSTKLEVITNRLKRNYSGQDNVNIEKITSDINLINNGIMYT